MKLVALIGLAGSGLGRSPYGERGLNLPTSGRKEPNEGRSPYGERGLKLRRMGKGPWLPQSLPVRGAWIEIVSSGAQRPQFDVAPRTGSVD